MSELRIGVVGAGVMGSGHIEYLTHHVDGAQVVAVAEPDHGMRQRVLDHNKLEASQWDTLEQMIGEEQLDAVVIASPDRFHAESVELCISQNIPALCEKPLAETKEDAERVFHSHSRWVREHDNRELVHLGFMRRFDAPYREAKSVIDSGELGAVLYVNASTRNVQSPGITSRQMLTNIAVHEIDVMRWLLSSEWETLDIKSPRATRFTGEGVSDPVVVTGSLESGVFVVADIFANNRYGYDVRTEITLEEGVLRIGIDGSLSVVKNHHVPSQPAIEMVDNWIPRFRPAYIEELRAWVGTLRGGPAPDLATIADGLAAVTMLHSLEI